MKLLYLHGFRSSPESIKAVAVIQYCRMHGLPPPIVPQLPVSPKASIRLCEQLIKRHQVDAICGSSLGGFYGMYLAEKHHLRCAVINPAITPWNELKEEHLQARYSVDQIERDDAVRYLAELHHYHIDRLTDIKRYLLLVALGDEVLDPVQMRLHFKGAHEVVVQGGTHALDDFGGHLNKVMTFLNKGG